MDELSNEIHAEMVEQERNELIELLKKTTIHYAGKELCWSLAAIMDGKEWCDWIVTLNGKTLYGGDSLIEALKILTKED